MSLGRLVTTITEHYINSVEKYNQIEYFNIATECLFNLFILYCLVAIANRQEAIDKRVNPSFLIEDDFTQPNSNEINDSILSRKSVMEQNVSFQAAKFGQEEMVFESVDERPRTTITENPMNEESEYAQSPDVAGMLGQRLNT